MKNYRELRSKWRKHITGGYSADIKDSDILNLIDTIVTNADQYWKDIKDYNNTGFIWNEFPMKEFSDSIYKTYSRLREMTLAYSTSGSRLFGNHRLLSEIRKALNWLYENKYNENTESYDNWWPWHIGVPLALNDIVILLFEELTEEEKLKFMTSIEHFTPDPNFLRRDTVFATGANRVDTAKAVAIRGIIVEDDKKICMARDALSQIFDYVTEGDGFYTDGSFVQHKDIPYTCSYGMVLIDGLSQLFNLLGGSPWEITDPKAESVYKWIYNSYEPLIYNGSAMDMVRGRAVSRHYLQDHNAGHVIIGAIARIAEFAPEKHRGKLRGMLKYWLLNDHCNSLYKDNGINTIRLLKEIKNDYNCIPMDAPSDNHIFANMDRVVHRRPGFALGISMYSNRIQNYEEMNDENKRAWYTGDGMTYLYNNDCLQYSDNFWPTVNAGRIPGTTVDSRERVVEIKRNTRGGQRRSENSWVGGVSLNKTYGVAGMELDSGFSTLTARKSWFMFDNEIVALGAGITSRDEYTVETVIQNYKIKDKGDNALIADGKKLPETIGEQDTLKGINWMHLEGNTDGSDIGYYFPERADIKVLREKRQGSWSEINFSEPRDVISRNYITFWLDHGKKPVNATYEYVILPNAEKDRTEEYSKNPDIKVISNSKEVQAVKNVPLGLLGANFWEDKCTSSDIITCSRKASVMLRDSGDTMELAVSDPTMENCETIDIVIHKQGYRLEIADQEVKVRCTEPEIELSINVKDAKGKTFSCLFKRI